MFKLFVLGLLVIASVFHTKDLIAQSMNTKALTHKAIKLSAKGNLKEALKIFQEIVKKEPNNIYALNNLGKAYSDLNKVEQAIASFQKALAINSGFWMAENKLEF